MRENCFSSSDCGFEPDGVILPKLSSVGRWRRLVVKPVWGEELCLSEHDDGRGGVVSCGAVTEIGRIGRKMASLQDWWDPEYCSGDMGSTVSTIVTVRSDEAFLANKGMADDVDCSLVRKVDS
jgi:hypothetical protein